MNHGGWHGTLPPDWLERPLYAVATERRSVNKGLRETNLLSLSYGRIVRKDIGSSEGLLPASFETYQIVEPGDVVLRLTDLQNDQRSLRSGLVTETGIITSAYLALRLHGAESRFIAYQLRAIDSMKIFYSMGGGLRQSIGYGDLKRLPLALPPVGEQRVIADYLDRETAQIEAFIAKNEELIALLKERRTAAVAKATTAGLGSATQAIPTQSPELGRIPEHWDVLQLRHLLIGIDQGVSPQADVGLAAVDQWGVLKSGCVNGGMFRPEEHKALPTDYPIDPAIVVKPGDLLVNRASGSLSLLGSAGIVSPSSFKLILSDKTFRLLPNNRVHTEYLYWWLNSRAYREQIAATVSGADGLANNLPMATLRGFVVPLPPKIEQAEIARHLSVVTAAADRAIHAARRAISLARERRAALISAAVTGKIDVGVAA